MLIPWGTQQYCSQKGVHPCDGLPPGQQSVSAVGNQTRRRGWRTGTGTSAARESGPGRASASAHSPARAPPTSRVAGAAGESSCLRTSSVHTYAQLRPETLGERGEPVAPFFVTSHVPSSQTAGDAARPPARTVCSHQILLLCPPTGKQRASCRNLRRCQRSSVAPGARRNHSARWSPYCQDRDREPHRPESQGRSGLARGTRTTGVFAVSLPRPRVFLNRTRSHRGQVHGVHGKFRTSPQGGRGRLGRHEPAKCSRPGWRCSHSRSEACTELLPCVHSFIPQIFIRQPLRQECCGALGVQQ